MGSQQSKCLDWLAAHILIIPFSCLTPLGHYPRPVPSSSAIEDCGFGVLWLGCGNYSHLWQMVLWQLAQTGVKPLLSQFLPQYVWVLSGRTYQNCHYCHQCLEKKQSRHYSPLMMICLQPCVAPALWFWSSHMNRNLLSWNLETYF